MHVLVMLIREKTSLHVAGNTAIRAALELIQQRGYVWKKGSALVPSFKAFAVVQLRQRYLDELQRRCPQGVARWLASGARAAGNPMTYLESRPRRSL